MRFLLLALLASLPTSNAFYPYLKDEQQSSQNSPRAVSRSRNVADNDLRVSIRKLPAKRANGFNILRAPTPAQENSLGVDEDGTDYSYFCSFKFGSSTEEYFMLLDSAASNTWVMSSDCKTKACGLHTLFGTKDSTTLKVDQTPFSVTYGTGSVQGIRGTDTAKLGTISVPLTFGLALNVSNEFSSFPMDGIVGLGRPDNIADKSGGIDAPSLMDVLISEKIISAKLFGIDLWRADDGGTNYGELNFGKADSSRYDGDLNYIAAIKNTNGFWELPVKDAGVNGNIAGLPGRTAIIDSGTSYILMPHDDALQLHELISGYKQDGSEMFTVPCDSAAKVQLTFGGITYDISPKDYIGRQASSGCSSNIIGRQTFGPKQWLVGDVFLKNVYTVFDFDGQRIGFGVKSNGAQAASSSSAGKISSADTTEITATITTALLTSDILLHQPQAQALLL
jgi:hypothetical protein